MKHPSTADIERALYATLASGQPYYRMSWAASTDKTFREEIASILERERRCGEQNGELPELCLLSVEHPDAHGWEMNLEMTL